MLLVEEAVHVHMSTSQRHVLIVAQEIEIRARIARVLQSAGHVVELAGSRTRALELVARKKIEAAVVVHSDDLNGLAQQLREQIPRTIMLGHQKGEARRSEHPPRGPEVPVTRAEFTLLSVFTRSPRQVLSRDQLRRSIAGRGAGSDDRSIDMLVARLRRKMEPNPKVPRFIVSVAGVGYKFAVPPQIAARGDAPATNELPNLSGLGDNTRSLLGQGVAVRHCDPERRHVTVLSCRLAGAATLATKAEPEDFGNTVRSFQGICTSVVTEWGGTITHFVGHEILALFGYPTGHEDDAERAVQAALELVARVPELLSSSGEPLQVQSAIGTGLVLINDNRTAIGEAIIVAGQLRTITPPNSVTVSARTRKLLGNMFVCGNPQQYKVEGISEPVTCYRVTGTRTVQSRFDPKSSEKLTQ